MAMKLHGVLFHLYFSWMKPWGSIQFFLTRRCNEWASETCAVIGFFFSMSRTWRYKCRNQLTSPTESALRHECIIHNYAHKGLSVWQYRRFQLDATHNQYQDWKHLAYFKTWIPLYETSFIQNTIYSTLILSAQETRKLYICFIKYAEFLTKM